MPVSAPQIELLTTQMVYDQEQLTADAGTITMRPVNEDLSWHTFTIDELDVDVDVPVNGKRTFTFDAPPGTYRFYCAVPG